MLERLGYRADVAANGLEALDALRRQNYDAVFMDVQMPELDGLEATRIIRQDFAYCEQPRIIAMTANAMSGDREVCLDAGMDDYVSKPVHVEELIGCLNRCQPRELREQGVAGDYLEIPVPGAAFEPIEVEDIMAQVIEMEELLRLKESLGEKASLMLPALVFSYYKQAEKLLAEMHAAIAAAHPAELRRAAHTLKANSASFGAAALAALCLQIEEQARSGQIEQSAQLFCQAEEEYARVRICLRKAQQTVLED
jgi:CheY-like chemotaxis protein